MRNLIVILVVTFVAFGCKKDKAVETSRYTVWIIPNLISSSSSPIQIKYRISGPDIKTIDDKSEMSISDLDLPKGKSTTINAAIYQGPSVDLYMKIYKKMGDGIADKLVFEQHGTGDVSAIFTVE